MIDNEVIIMYDECKIMGPYKRRSKDKKSNKYTYRLDMQITYPDGHIRYISANRYAMELHLGRKLTKNEVVIHKDGDIYNNDISNLKLSTSGYGFNDTIIECTGIYNGWKITSKLIINTKKHSSPRVTIFMRNPNNKRIIKSYPIYLMEMHLGRFLNDNETVDHIDHNTLNNDISNLRVITKEEHYKDDVIRLKPQKFICPNCGKEFEVSGKRLQRILRHQRKRHLVNKPYYGPFCNQQCACSVSNKIFNKSNENVVEAIYTTNKIERLELDKTNPHVKKYLSSVDKKIRPRK